MKLAEKFKRAIKPMVAEGISTFGVMPVCAEHVAEAVHKLSMPARGYEGRVFKGKDKSAYVIIAYPGVTTREEAIRLSNMFLADDLCRGEICVMFIGPKTRAEILQPEREEVRNYVNG